MIHAYIVTFLAIILAYMARNESKRKALLWAFILITTFLSLGYMWGNDVYTYERWFWNFNSYKLFDFDSYEELSAKSEYGFVLINQLCAGIGFWGMRTVLFAFENIVVYLLIKKTVPPNYYWLAVFVYTVNPWFMILGSSMMRQWLAMCIVMLGFLFLEKRRWLWYLILVITASTIHRSSLICVPLVVLPYITFKFKKTSLVWLIPAIAIYFVLSGYIVQYAVGWLMTEEMYTNYTDAIYSSGVGILAIIYFLIYGLMIININQIERDKRIYVAALIGYGLVLPMYNYSGLAARLGYYFTIFTIAAYPLFFAQAKLDGSFKKLLMFVIIVLTIYANVMFFANPMWFQYYGNYVTLFKAGIL